MTAHPIDSFAHGDGVPRPTRFVLVNERIPRTDGYCALCCERIDDGYVRDPHTRLLYCDAACFAAHEKMSLPVSPRHARRVS
jgi:hypothetical protein